MLLQKVIFIGVLFLVDFSQTNKAEDFTSFIQQLTENEEFLENYTHWSQKLFSEPNYLYGRSRKRFSCPLDTLKTDRKIPESVHRLQPADINCIAALGDSFMTGLASHAITPLDLRLENRGISWAIGGDYSSSTMISLPNLLRQYNANLTGYSRTISKSGNDSDFQLDFSKSNSPMIDVIDQAKRLVQRLKNGDFCSWQNDWKIVNFFIGIDDFCQLFHEENSVKENPIDYQTPIESALDELYKSNLPRTLVNLIPVFDIRAFNALLSASPVCSILQKKFCPCASLSDSQQNALVDKTFHDYHQFLDELTRSEKFNKRDDFTVVLQPFLSKLEIPNRDDGTVDFTYFAPDCFHFSGKGHSQVAIGLWNNMLEPIGTKSKTFHFRQTLKCPSAEYPFIFTVKNSPAHIEEVSIVSTVALETMTEVLTTQILEEPDDTTISGTPNNRKEKPTKLRTIGRKIKIFAMIIVLGMFIGILLIAIRKRYNISLWKNLRQQNRFKRFDNPVDMDENDEVEVWSYPKGKLTSVDDHEITRTHGTRLTLE